MRPCPSSAWRRTIAARSPAPPSSRRPERPVRSMLWAHQPGRLTSSRRGQGRCDGGERCSRLSLVSGYSGFGGAVVAATVAHRARISARRHADNALEIAREVALIREPGRVHDVREREPVPDETPRLLNTHLLEVFVRRQAE